HAERLRHAAGEYRAVAAEGEEREFARVAAALARYRADRTDHVRRRNEVGTVRRALERHAKGFSYFPGEHFACFRSVQFERAADEMRRIEVAQQQIGVGDRRRLAALAVVPPMSKVMIFGRRFSRASACAPTTPPAGPDSMMWIGRSTDAASVVRPPFDCISSSRARTPASSSPLRSAVR